MKQFNKTVLAVALLAAAGSASAATSTTGAGVSFLAFGFSAIFPSSPTLPPSGEGQELRGVQHLCFPVRKHPINFAKQVIRINGLVDEQFHRQIIDIGFVVQRCGTVYGRQHQDRNILELL